MSLVITKCMKNVYIFIYTFRGSNKVKEKLRVPSSLEIQL